MHQKTRYRYQFNGGMCWECKSHRATPAAGANQKDWERVVIAFERDRINEIQLQDFLRKLAAALSIAWLSNPPRKSPFAGIGRIIFGPAAALFSKVDRVNLDSCREDMWIVIESSSIFDNGRYYCAAAPHRMILVLRNGLDLVDLAGQVVDAALGNDPGWRDFVRPGNESQIHSKLTVYRVLLNKKSRQSLSRLLASSPKDPKI